MDARLFTADRRRTLFVVLLLLVALCWIVLLRLTSSTAELSAPHIASAPESRPPTTSFAFSGEGPFECALDSVLFVDCVSPVSYGRLPLGRHVFMVRSIGPNGVRSDVAVVHLRISGRSTDTGVVVGPSASAGAGSAVAEEGLRVGISGNVSGSLAPGRGGPLLLRITNPHAFPIEFTRLRVTAEAGSTHRGCDGRVDLGVRQSSLSGGTAAVRVPAKGTITLPQRHATAPFVWMRNRRANQDACKGARFVLHYEGDARRVQGG